MNGAVDVSREYQRLKAKSATKQAHQRPNRQHRLYADEILRRNEMLIAHMPKTEIAAALGISYQAIYKCEFAKEMRK